MVVLDVVEDILSRLLVKDLLRCKSVCKSWYSFVSSPSFANTHCKFMSNKEDSNTKKITMRPRKSWSIEGSSHGLVCIYKECDNRITITNPLTGEFRELPRPPLGRVTSYYLSSTGFGYDLTTDDYKVVVMATCNSNYTLFVRIFSLKSNIWKYFGQINYSCGPMRPGILFNGALHWFLFDANDYKASIMAFDLAKEEFREIPQPDDTSYFWHSGYSLGISEGSLCIIKKRSRVNDPPSRIWVMKNYNDKPSWEVLPITKYCQMKDHAIHYMPPPPSYFCDENIQLSSSEKHFSSPIFVQTLVSPYVNTNNGKFGRIRLKRERPRKKRKWSGKRKIIEILLEEGKGGIRTRQRMNKRIRRVSCLITLR